MHPKGCIFFGQKLNKMIPQKGCLLIICMRRAYAIRPYRIVTKYSLGSYFQTQILAHPLIPLILVQSMILVYPRIPSILVQKPSPNLLHLKIKILVLEGFIL